ncbi:peptidoglycan-binding protein [Jannaschia sp. M317]|uniref:peptidoglycan-binding domain-containing protein n=1 Tax=Jannaschia sp. M317 TaxID=2867011 RepID=UPI0021A3AD9A|nr:peptidoglycan-binding domain-containing protein [Jannaschia sp. M317]UWQ17087.1 peptidoglycan-binding protein [Jannaschia sp. M317]
MGAIVGSIISARPDAGPDAPRRPTRATSSRQTPEAQRAENRLIQTKLNALGHDTGTPDGLIGRKTRAAITSWQASIGAAPTGTLTPAQRRLLLGQRSAPPRAPMIASTPTPVAPIPAEPDTD